MHRGRQAGAAIAAVLIVGALLSSTSAAAGAVPPVGVWELVAPGVVGDPATTSVPSEEYVDTFIRQGSRVIHHRYGATAWPVQDLGGIASSDPATAATADGTYVFAIGADDAVWYRLIDAAGAATPWATLGGIARRNPAAAVDPQGVLHLYAIGTDDSVWTRPLVDGAWGPWQGLGGVVTSDPAAWPGGVAARGLDGSAWRTYGAVWEDLGGFIVGEPAVGPSGDIGVLAPNGQIFLGPAWGGTTGYAVAPPTLTGVGPRPQDRLAVYGRAANGRIYVEYRGRGRSGWIDLGGNAISQVSGGVTDYMTTCDYTCYGERIYAVGVDRGLYTYLS